MRFAMFMIPKVYQSGTPLAERAGEGFAPPAEAVAEMMKFNEKMEKAGVLMSLDGLHPISKGARVAFSAGKPRVTEGSLIKATDIIGGYWIIDVKSKTEAVEWAKRIPAEDGDIVEIRQIFEMSDFPPDVKKAASSPTMKAKTEKHQ